LADYTIEYTVIAAIGMAYAVLSLYVTKRFGNRERVKEIQKQINDVTKNYNEAAKRKDEGEMKRLEAEQGKMPGLLRESMVLQFKPLVILLPFLLLFPYIVRYLYPQYIITLPFDLPIFIQHFESFPNWRAEFGAVGWFYLSFFIASMLLQILPGIRNRIWKPKAKQDANQTADAVKGA
jgi:uncharacterized membrane protein (DUF106 family)